MEYFLKLNYRINRNIILDLNGSVTSYKFGSQKPDSEYIESLIRTSIKYSF